MEHDSQQESLAKVTVEMKDLEIEMQHRNNQITNLEKDLKDTNLQEFLVLPADAIKDGRLCFL